MKKSFFILLAFIVGMACTPQTNGGTTIEKLAKQEFISQLQEDKTNSILLDVRTPKEYSKGSIEGAININYYDDDFSKQLQKLDTTKIVFVYCKLGGRSASAAKKIAKLGFPKVYDLKGGYLGYIKN